MTQSPPKKSARVADAAVFLAAITAIAVVVNIFLNLPSSPSPRIDLTEDKLYTLSAGSTKLVQSLAQPLTIKLFISENLQYPDHNLEQRITDLLQEYENTSAGNLTFEVIHPKDQDPTPQDPNNPTPTLDPNDPRGFGIEKIPVGMRGKDEVALRMVYKGLAFVYGDAIETIPEVRGTDNLEYEISKRIKVLTTAKDDRNTVGFVSGFGGPADQPQFVQSINNAFGQIYNGLITAENVNLSSSKTIPDHIDALVLLNPQKPLDPSAQFAVDQFLMKGHGVAWFQTTNSPNPQMPMMPGRTPVKTDLAPLFAHYGLSLQNDLVLDRQNNIVALTFTDQGLVSVSNPTMPKFTDINETSIITRDIPTLSFPFASSITLGPKLQPDNPDNPIRVFELVKTSRDAVARSDISSLSYEQLLTPTADEKQGPFLVAAALQGPLESFWNGKDAPTPTPDTTPPPKLDQANASARVVVVANGDFMFPNPESGYDQQFASLGAMFLLNSVDWLVQDEDLITIRAKGLPRVIKNVAPEEYSAYQFINIAGIPALVALFGLLLWFLRKQRQDAIRVYFKTKK